MSVSAAFACASPAITCRGSQASMSSRACAIAAACARRSSPEGRFASATQSTLQHRDAACRSGDSDRERLLETQELPMPRFTTRTLVALGVALVLWASAFAGIRAGLRAYSPSHLAILRFLVASLVLAIYAAVVHFRRPEVRDLPGLALTGLIGITFYNIALNYGETRVTAGAASLLIASVPIWTALFARFMLHEKLTALGWVGVLLSFAGVALIASGEGEGIRLSPQALVILAAALTSSVYMIMQKHYLGRYSALEFTAYSIWFGTLLMLPFGSGFFHELRTAPLAATLSVIYLGIFPGALAYRVAASGAVRSSWKNPLPNGN